MPCLARQKLVCTHGAVSQQLKPLPALPTRRCTTRPARSLISRRLADRCHYQALHPTAWIVAVLLGKAWVNHILDTVDRERGFRDVGGNDYLARTRRCGLEDLGLRGGWFGGGIQDAQKTTQGTACTKGHAAQKPKSTCARSTESVAGSSCVMMSWGSQNQACYRTNSKYLRDTVVFCNQITKMIYGILRKYFGLVSWWDANGAGPPAPASSDTAAGSMSAGAAPPVSNMPVGSMHMHTSMVH